MATEERIKALEDEIKILKNEIKAVLLDLREQYLNIQNPFNYNMSTSADTFSSVGTEQGDKETNIDEGVGEAKTDNAFPEVKAVEDQRPASELPGRQKAKKASGSGPEIKMIESSGTDSAMLGAGPEITSEEEFEEAPPTKAASLRNKKKGKQSFAEGDGKSDIVVIAGLTQWIDQSTAKLGKERTEALVEMSSTMGRLPPDIKDALVRMARLSLHEPNVQSITASDYLSVLAQLENLISGSKLQDNALLSILSMMQETNNG
jgi:hypothetical protein